MIYLFMLITLSKFDCQDAILMGRVGSYFFIAFEDLDHSIYQMQLSTIVLKTNIEIKKN